MTHAVQDRMYVEGRSATMTRMHRRYLKGLWACKMAGADVIVIVVK